MLAGMDWAGLLLFAIIVVPIILGVALHKTRVWWLPGAGLLVGGGGILTTIEPVHDDVGGIGAFGNGVVTLCALAVIAYGFILLVVTGIAHERARRAASPKPPELPTATVIRDSK
jgi:hypothetical protein